MLRVEGLNRATTTCSSNGDINNAAVIYCTLTQCLRVLFEYFRRQYGEDLDSFITGKTKANWLLINHETNRLKTVIREDIIKLLTPLVCRSLCLPADALWTKQVTQLVMLHTCVVLFYSFHYSLIQSLIKFDSILGFSKSKIFCVCF